MNELITLAARHNWQQGLKVNQAVWELKNTIAVDRLCHHGYIDEIAHRYGFNYRLTGKAIEWLKHNHIIKFNYKSLQYILLCRKQGNDG